MEKEIQVALPHHITDTKAADNERIPELVEPAKKYLPRVNVFAKDGLVLLDVQGGGPM